MGVPEDDSAGLNDQLAQAQQAAFDVGGLLREIDDADHRVGHA